MEILIVAIVGGCLVGLAAGGSLERLASTTFRWTPLLFVGLGGQILFQNWSPDALTSEMKLTILLASNALVAGFLVLNRRLPGTLLAAIGLALNVVVIGVNGAMPVSAAAAEAVGIDEMPQEGGFKHEPLDAQTRLPLLADALAIPLTRTVYSLGDVYLALGIGYLVFSQTRGAKGRHRIRRDSPAD